MAPFDFSLLAKIWRINRESNGMTHVTLRWENSDKNNQVGLDILKEDLDMDGSIRPFVSSKDLEN